jgi:predicted transcriptional regulator
MARTAHTRAVSYRLPPELIDRLKTLAQDRHWTDSTALRLLLDDALTREGYPRKEPADGSQESSPQGRAD